MKIVYTGKQDSRAYKQVYGPAIDMITSRDPDVVYLDADLSSCIGTQSWALAHPEKAINCGIAEANMVGIACGLSSLGFKPIIHSFGPFASRRCYDQVYLSGGYAGNSLTIIGSDPGVCAQYNGGTHMPFEDIALYRALPGAHVFDITDPNMLIDILSQCVDIPGVKYIRCGRKESYTVYEDGAPFDIGKGVIVREGRDATIIACGIMVHEALQAAAALEKDGISARVVDMFTLKPIDEELIKKCAADTGVIVTAENHNKIGGLYSAVCEALHGGMGAYVDYVAVEDEFGEVGPIDYLQQRFGLTAEHIVDVVKASLAHKRA